MARPEFDSLFPLLKITAWMSGASLGLYLLLWVFGLFLTPEMETTPLSYPEETIRDTEQLRDISIDDRQLPRLQVEVDYSKGESALWWPKGEAPVLQRLVYNGQLPPVEERVGPHPVVYTARDGIGNYGGTWMRVANAPGDVSIITWRLSYPTLVRWSPLGYPVVPHLAKRWEVNEDYTEWTFFLRPGIRWSDGEPFTADDILYWWEYDIKAIGPIRPDFMKIRGTVGEIEKVDDFTIRMVFEHPHGLLLERMASGPEPNSPRHYLEKYHPDIGDDAVIENALQEEGLTSRRALYTRKKDFLNPEHPRMWPWVYRTYKRNPPQVFVRNPYYWMVDEAGNQLPYIDRVQFEVRNPRLIPNLVASGMISMQARHLYTDDYTLYMSERERQGFEMYHWYSAARSVWTLFPNLNRITPPDDPVAQMKYDLLNNRDFRIALSLAINRQAIIRAAYSGIGEPAQLSPGRESFFHHEGLHTAYTEFDPERANALLDEIGLTRRDAEGFRTFPDGTRMTWNIDYTDFTGEGPVQFVINDWERVGIRARQRDRNRPLFFVEKSALMHDFTVWTGESEFHPLVEARSFVPTYGETHQAQAYGVWFQQGGLFGADLSDHPGAWEPAPGSPIRRTMEYYAEAKGQTDPEDQRDLMSKALDINAEELFTINVSTPPPQLVVVKDGLRNVPDNALYGAAYRTPGNAGMETYFFEEPFETLGTIRQTEQEILQATLPPRLAAARGESGGLLTRLLQFTIGAIVVCGLFLLSQRHPFVGRRLLILVPTLLIISLVVFSIIQAPPGSFMESKIRQGELTNDQGIIEQVRQIREIFPVEAGFWTKYADWMGMKWFFTFNSRDTGLLQGDLGYSMETLRKVNDMVGDRILLTVMISLGTILLTWVLALPIGVYSAVRQYTVADYVLTLIGFIGMCVPNFLLALLLMYWSDRYFGMNITGLFSEEFAAQPYWDIPKFIDLLKHLWVPIVVLAVGGTATMIRVMRGNLLDELNKPYVVTARAKGVRPFKLLVKYPVRLALNPFISGIGSLFPQLISGGAIVALVLSLPTVGPLMLDALLTEDLYLAGSMLMVLSLLGVLGTLVSDLLLLWLDPRIRYEGGSR